MAEIFEKDEYQFPGENPSRNQLQKTALFAIYDALTYLDMKEPVPIESIVAGLCETTYEEADYFVKAALIYSIKHYEEIVKIFNDHMNKWTFDRLNRVEQALLLLSYVHYFHIGEVEKAVVIDVAVNLAKAYLDQKDYRFVNGILDNVLVK